MLQPFAIAESRQPRCVPVDSACMGGRYRGGRAAAVALLASLAAASLAASRPAAAQDCQVAFAGPSAISVARGRAAQLPIRYRTNGPCSWQIHPSVPSNPLDVSGSFLFPPAPLQPDSSGLILGTLTAPPGAPLGSYEVQVRVDLTRLYQSMPREAEPEYLPVVVTVVPAAPPAPAMPAITGYAATNPRGVPIFSAPPGAPLLIEGSNLGTGGTVAFNGIAATPPAGWSPTEILVTVPAARSYPFHGPVTVTVNGQTAVGPSFTITPPPVSQLEDQALQAIGAGLSQAGQALIASRAGVGGTDPGQVPAVTAQGLSAAAAAIQGSALRLSELKAQGLSLDDGWLNDYTTMGIALSLAARSTATGSYDQTKIALQLFATEMASAFPTTPGARQPAVGMAFAAARDRAETTADMAGFLADLKREGKIAGRLAEIASQVGRGPADLQQAAGSVLALDDPAIRYAMGLEDAETISDLQNLGALSAETAVVDWSAAVVNDPVGWSRVRLPFAFGESVFQVGDSLNAGGGLVLAGLGSRIPCEDLCTESNLKLDCGVTDLGISTGGADTANPDDLKSLGKALDLLGLVPGSKLSPLGEAAQKDVLKAMKGLIGILKNARPTVWIKVKWNQCESERCFPYVWTSHDVLVEHTSDWTKLDLPDSLLGKRVDQWDGRDLQAIRDAAAKKAKELCH